MTPCEHHKMQVRVECFAPALRSLRQCQVAVETRLACPEDFDPWSGIFVCNPHTERFHEYSLRFNALGCRTMAPQVSSLSEVLGIGLGVPETWQAGG